MDRTCADLSFGGSFLFFSCTNFIPARYTNHPDTNFYGNSRSTGRWDSAYMQEDEATGGFVAFPVATPSLAPGPGLMRSDNGLNWTVEAPIPVDYDGVTPSALEFGGTEKMPNGKYYLIGGGEPFGMGYSMWTLVSHSGNVTVRSVKCMAQQCAAQTERCVDDTGTQTQTQTQTQRYRDTETHIHTEREGDTRVRAHTHAHTHTYTYLSFHFFVSRNPLHATLFICDCTLKRAIPMTSSYPPLSFRVRIPQTLEHTGSAGKAVGAEQV